MTRDEETLFLRKLQEADRTECEKHLTLKTREYSEDGRLTLSFDAQAKEEAGYLHIVADPATEEIIACEMDVGFPTPLGLNRSPLELRILAEHILALYGASETHEQHK